MKKNTIIISLCFLAAGFAAAYLIFGYKTDAPSSQNDKTIIIRADGSKIISPFSVKDNTGTDDSRIEYLEAEVETIKQQLHQMAQTLQELIESQAEGSTETVSTTTINSRNRYASALSQRLYNLDNLIKGGIDPSLAEDIVRRKNSIELKRLALQDRATRDGYLNTQQYFDELEEINSNDVSLREELGDELYDEYLFNSKQNNRIRIASVMLGSAAEQAGILKGDVVLSYDNKRMFTWQELKDATTAGQLGEYVSISIYRNGEIFSFSVPRGPLGLQLGATRLTP